jgi:hypothetical protein
MWKAKAFITSDISLRLGMRNLQAIGCATVAALATLGTAGSTSATGSARLLEINGVAGDIDVKTSAGAPFKVEIIPGRKMTAELVQDGGTLRVQGPLGNNTRSQCSNRGQGSARSNVLTINGTDDVEGDLPRILVTGPNTMGLRIKRSLVKGQVGDVGGATISHTSCGDLIIGNVARDLQASVSGPGNIRVGNIGRRTEANVAGSGNLQLGDIGTDLELNIGGSGDTRIGSVKGRAQINSAGSGNVDVKSVLKWVEVNVAGSGDVNLLAGRSELSANIAGSGDVRHSGTVINPKVNIVGAGDVIVARVEGQPRVSKLGSGEFRID